MAERPARALGTRNVPRAVREREMVEAARRLFSERGYESVSMEEVAAAAGVTKPMVYAYFESKEGLFLACVDAATEELMRVLEEQTPADLAPDVRLWRGLLAVFTFVEESRDTWAMLHPRGQLEGGRVAAGAARSTQAMTEVVGRVLCDAAVAQGVDPNVAREATEPMSHALVAAVQAVAAWWLRHPEEPKERAALRVMNFAWMGLDNLVSGRLWLPPADDGSASPRSPVASIDAAARSDELARALREHRDPTLDEVFRRMAAAFAPERAGDLETVIEWRIGGRPRGGHDRFQLAIADGECRVARGRRARPAVIFTIAAEDFARMLGGSVDAAALFTSGRMRVDGDMMLAARVPTLFVR